MMLNKAITADRKPSMENSALADIAAKLSEFFPRVMSSAPPFLVKDRMYKSSARELPVKANSMGIASFDVIRVTTKLLYFCL